MPWQFEKQGMLLGTARAFIIPGNARGSFLTGMRQNQGNLKKADYLTHYLQKLDSKMKSKMMLSVERGTEQRSGLDQRLRWQRHLEVQVRSFVTFCMVDMWPLWKWMSNMGLYSWRLLRHAHQKALWKGTAAGRSAALGWGVSESEERGESQLSDSRKWDCDWLEGRVGRIWAGSWLVDKTRSQPHCSGASQWVPFFCEVLLGLVLARWKLRE